MAGSPAPAAASRLPASGTFLTYGYRVLDSAQ